MDFFYTLTFFILTVGILYLILNHRFTKLLDAKFQEQYTKKMHQDMQEFYREMETYSLIFDNKIKSFKNLIEKQQEQLNEWAEIVNALKKSKNTKELVSLINRSRKKDDQMMQILSQLSQFSSSPLNKLNEKMQIPLSKPDLNPDNKTSKNLIKKEHPKEKPKNNINQASPKRDFYDPANNFAEESLSALDSNDSYAINDGDSYAEKIDKNTPLQKDGLASFIKSLGKTVAPSIIKASKPTIASNSEEKTKNNKPSNLQNEKQNPSKTQGRQNQPSFSDLLSKKQIELETKNKMNKTSGITMPISNIDEKTLDSFNLENDPVFDSLRFDDEDRPSQQMESKNTSIAKLDPKELFDLIKKIQKTSERPKALSILLENGFDISQIAELSSISLSELEFTKKIHEISPK